MTKKGRRQGSASIVAVQNAIEQTIRMHNISEEEAAGIFGSNDFIRKNEKCKLGDLEFDFGSPEHVRVLNHFLEGLEALRLCYRSDSANRHIYSLACRRIKKLIAKHSHKLLQLT